MTPILIFALGIALLAMFLWYFGTDSARTKRLIGTVLTVGITGLCVTLFTPPSKEIKGGIDLVGGSKFVMELKPGPGKEISSTAVDQAISIVRDRLNFSGTKDLFTARMGDKRFVVKMPGLEQSEISFVQEQLTKPAVLEFRILDGAETDKASAEGYVPPVGLVVKEIKPDAKKIKDAEAKGETAVPEKVVISDPALKDPDFQGKHVTKAWPSLQPEGWIIMVEVDSEGADIMGELTQLNVGKRMAMIVDGEVLSAPVIQGRFTDSFQISGDFNELNAPPLASALENPLEFEMAIVDSRTIDPSMGKDNVAQGIFAALAGLAIVLVFIVFYYRFAGLIAMTGLTVNICILLGALAAFKFSLTLAGIAGIILTIGMAIDANVLIYERLREEMAAGKSLGHAIRAAYDKAFTAIFDANLTTIITATVLLWLGSDQIKGFATTLLIGIIGSMFSALLVTRICFRWLTDAGKLKKLSFFNLIRNKNIDFLGKRRIAYVFSITLLLVALGTLIFRGNQSLGVDFAGGIVVDARFDEDISQETEDKVRARFKEITKDLGLEETPIIEKNEAISADAGSAYHLVVRSRNIEASDAGGSEEDAVNREAKLADRIMEEISAVVGRDYYTMTEGYSSDLGEGDDSIKLLQIRTAKDVTAEAINAKLAAVTPALDPLPKATVIKGENGERNTIQIETKVDKKVNQSEAIISALEGESGLGFQFFQASKDTVGSALGGEMLIWSGVALLVGLVLIFLYVSFRFEFAFAIGAIAALFHDVFIAIGLIVLLGQELSLVHIGAFLTIAGYSINDTIVVFDRVRDGLRTKRGKLQDIMNGCLNQTLSRTVLTSFTTLIAILTLFFFGGPEMREFSGAIIIGVLVGTFSSIFVASPIVLWWATTFKKNLRREILDADLARGETADQSPENA